MAGDLETELRTAVKNGFLDFRLWRVWDGTKWLCAYRTTDSNRVFDAEDSDPVEALRKALRAGTRESKTVQSNKPKRRVDDLA